MKFYVLYFPGSDDCNLHGYLKSVSSGIMPQFCEFASEALHFDNKLAANLLSDYFFLNGWNNVVWESEAV